MTAALRAGTDQMIPRAGAEAENPVSCPDDGRGDNKKEDNARKRRQSRGGTEQLTYRRKIRWKKS